jgi:hypothetical protein
MVFLPPNRTDNVLLGAKVRHFEMVFHAAPPRWRLKGERKNSKFMKRLQKRKVKKNQIRLDGDGAKFSTPSDLGYLARKPSITLLQIS